VPPGGLCRPDKRLSAGLADGDKAAVADALQTAGIAYTIDRDTGNIGVGEDDVHKARMMLAGRVCQAAPAAALF
jgi:flagellar M-ring protein FliF